MILERYRIRTLTILQRYSIAGIAIWPMIFVAKDSFKNNKVLINHEKIHLIQQLELLLIVFIKLYFGQYFISRLKKKTHREAYKTIALELEAKHNERNLNYLRERKLYSFIKYYKRD